MRRIALLVALVMLVSTGGIAAADGPATVGPVYPYRPQDWPDNTVTVHVGDIILLGARWGACTKGLAMMAAKNLTWDYYLDGEPISTEFVFGRPVRTPSDTSACIPRADAGWWVFAESPLVINEPGLYSLSLEISASHPLIDGGDYDGDGRLDRFEGMSASIDVLVEP